MGMAIDDVQEKLKHQSEIRQKKVHCASEKVSFISYMYIVLLCLHNFF